MTQGRFKVPFRGQPFGLAVLLVFPLAVLLGGLVLRFTHHRALGAATWTVAVLALVWVIEVTLERARVGRGTN